MLPPFSITFRVCFPQLLTLALTFLQRNICNRLQTQTNKTSFALPLLPFLCYEVPKKLRHRHITFFCKFHYIFPLFFCATDIYPFVFGHCITSLYTTIKIILKIAVKKQNTVAGIFNHHKLAPFFFIYNEKHILNADKEIRNAIINKDNSILFFTFTLSNLNICYLI